MPWRSGIWWLLIASALALGVVGDWRLARAPFLPVCAPWALSALAVLAIAAWCGDRERTTQPSRPSWTRNAVWALLSVLAAAALTRLWRITEYPPPDLFGFEEYQTGAVAYSVYNTWRVPLEFPLTNFLPGISFHLFGLTSYALRASFVLSGLIAPPLLFLALRRVVALPAAWATAMLFAVARYPAVGARFADEVFFPISIVALSFWLLVRAIQRPRYTSAFALALASSDLLYAYTGYKVYPFIAAAGVGLIALGRRARGRLPPGTGRRLVLVAAVWAALLGPGLMISIYGDGFLFDGVGRHYHAWLSAPSQEHSLQAVAARTATRMRDSWKLFVVQDPESLLTIPGEPIFDPVTATLLTLSLVAAVWRWRNPWRLLTLATFSVPFAAVALFPANFYAQRYFVLVVPLFVLIGFFLDDLLRWRVGPPAWRSRGLFVAVAVAAVLNFRGLQRLIDSPVVHASLTIPENLVVAAIHRAPAGARVVLLTHDARNALEPSDFTWFLAHLRGGLAQSLAEALTLRPDDHGPVYWVTQGAPEAQFMLRLVQLVCPDATSEILPAPNPIHRMSVVSVPSAVGCRALPSLGLSAVYTVESPKGRTQEIQQIDPALMGYTIPWRLVAELAEPSTTRLHAHWQGSILPTRAGPYAFRLELSGATGSLRVQDADVGAEQKLSLTVEMATAAVPVAVDLEALPGTLPRVRLYWTPPEEPEQLIPPTQLRPTAQVSADHPVAANSDGG